MSRIVLEFARFYITSIHTPQIICRSTSGSNLISVAGERPSLRVSKRAPEIIMVTICQHVYLPTARNREVSIAAIASPRGRNDPVYPSATIELSKRLRE